MKTAQRQSAAFDELAGYLKQEGALRREAMESRMAEKIAELKRETKRKEEKLLAEGRREFRTIGHEIESVIVGQAERDAKALVSQRMADAAEELLKSCLEHLKQFSNGPDYPVVLKGLLSEAIEYATSRFEKKAGGESPFFVIHASAAECAICEEFVAEAACDAKVQEDSTLWGGVEVRIPTFSYAIRNTLASRLKRLEPRLRDLILTRFESAADGEARQ